MRRLTIVAALALAGCLGSGQADYPEHCQDKALTELVLKHAAELVVACAGYDSLEACPQEKQEQIDRAHEKQYAEWKDCNR